MTDEIPKLLPPDQMPPIEDQAGLEHHWRAMMGELGFAAPQLWVLFIDPHGIVAGALQVKEMPQTCTDEDIAALRDLHEHLPGFTHAFLFARPGQRARTDGDMCWARGLARLTHELGGTWPVHLANDFELTVVAPDDLAAAS